MNRIGSMNLCIGGEVQNVQESSFSMPIYLHLITGVQKAQVVRGRFHTKLRCVKRVVGPQKMDAGLGCTIEGAMVAEYQPNSINGFTNILRDNLEALSV